MKKIVVVNVSRSGASEEKKKKKDETEKKDEMFRYRISECVFDITTVANRLIFDGVIQPKDDRELFSEIYQLARKFEEEFDEMKDDYPEAIERFAENHLFELFKEDEYENAKRIVSRISATSFMNPIDSISGNERCWTLWRDIKSMDELDAVKAYCFDLDSYDQIFIPERFPCTIVTVRDDDGKGAIIMPDKLEKMVALFSSEIESLKRKK